MAYSNYSDVRSLYHSKHLNSKFYICFSPNKYTYTKFVLIANTV